MTKNPMTHAAQLLILGYQRLISPYKGFGCAYRIHTGHRSCSAFGLKAIRLFGVQQGLALIQERTHLCSLTNRHHHRQTYRPVQQRGDIDCGFNDCFSCLGDINPLDCCDCSWDRRNKNWKPPLSERIRKRRDQIQSRKQGRPPHHRS